MISEKIVVIDDEDKVIKSICLLLPEYEIIPFSDGDKAVEYLRSPNSVNLVLLDVMMPKFDGLILLQEIKRLNKNIGVIIMTGYGSKEVMLQALRAHADDFIEKPFRRTELKERVSIVLRSKLHDKNLRKNKDDQVDRMKRFIERNCDNVNLEFIANEMCISARYASRLFKQKNKVNYRNYKLQIRIDKGKKLLTETAKTVSEIAFVLGYQNPETFMRMFKQATSLTPSEYRAKHKVQEPQHV